MREGDQRKPGFPGLPLVGWGIGNANTNKFRYLRTATRPPILQDDSNNQLEKVGRTCRVRLPGRGFLANHRHTRLARHASCSELDFINGLLTT